MIVCHIVLTGSIILLLITWCIINPDWCIHSLIGLAAKTLVAVKTETVSEMTVVYNQLLSL